MNQFNLGNFVNKFLNYPSLNPKEGPPKAPMNTDVTFQLNQNSLAENLLQKSMPQNAALKTFNPSLIADLKMNNLASLERGVYIKDLMNLPKEMQEVLVLIQNNMTSAGEMSKLLATNINLAALAELMKQGGKEAMAKLIMVMANSAKQGVTDVSQIKDAIKFINASVSVAAQDNPNQILKSFMLLYLPWLPLQEGVDFDLEIESSEDNTDGSETSITIMISTRNYGNVKVTLVLLAGNFLSIFINCSENFPKEELLKRINSESKKHSMQSDVTFEQKAMKQDENAPRQAKISLSNLMQVSPFLLLMANAIIRHTIELDNEF